VAEFDVRLLDAWTQQSMSVELTPAEKMLRDKFVSEYLLDHDAEAALSRVGFQAGFVADYAKKFMSESYVQQQIAARTLQATPENQDELDKLAVRATLRKQMARGGGAVSVSAAVQMAKLLGMEAPTKTLSEVTLKSAVQFYIPHNGRDAVNQPAEAK